MIPIPEPDLQWGEGALAKVVERPLPTYALITLKMKLTNLKLTLEN